MDKEKKIAERLKKAKQVIEAEPELLNMSPDEILDKYDEPGNEMIGIRWGIVAYGYLENLKVATNEELVQKLQRINSGVLTCEYLGYLLQQEQKINLVELFLKAYEVGGTDEILPFVQSNIIYDKEWHEKNLDRFLQVVREKKNDHRYETLLRNYAYLIVVQHKEEVVLTKDLKNDDYSLLMSMIGLRLYEVDSKYADKILDEFFLKKTGNYNDLIIKFLERSIYYSVNEFEKHFVKIEILVEEKKEYWEQLIKVYIRYIRGYVQGSVRNIVLKRLALIANGSIKEKEEFVSELKYSKEECYELDNIVKQILKSGFEKSGIILDSLDYMFYGWLRSGKEAETLESLQKIFCLNKFGLEYRHFFETLSSTHSELVNHQKLVIEKVIYLIDQGTTQELFFALALLDQAIDKNQFASNLKETMIDENKGIKIIQGVLYFMIDAKAICKLAFEIAKIIPINCERYIKVCREEIFPNFPYTFSDFAEENKNNINQNVRLLAIDILDSQNNRLKIAKEGYEIPDLKPSQERMMEYRRAQLEQNNKISKVSEKNSVFSDLFPIRKLKYGKRFAFIQTGKHGKLSYQVNEPAKISYEMELPQLFMKDEQLLTFSRSEYIKKRKENYETCNKRVSCEIKGKE